METSLKAASANSWIPEPATSCKCGERQTRGLVAAWYWIWVPFALTLAAVYLLSGVTDLQKKNNIYLEQSVSPGSTKAVSYENYTGSGSHIEKNVRVWSPDMRSCRGRFIVPRLNESLETPPVLMLREAEVDLRHNSLQEIDAKQLAPSLFRRIVVHVSAARDVTPILPVRPALRWAGTEPFPDANIAGGDEAKREGWQANIDYIISDVDLRCINNGIKVPRYKHYQWNGGEWQIILTITGPRHFKTDDEFQKALEELAHEATPSSCPLLELNLPAHLPKEETLTNLQLSLTFGCVAGLLGSDTLQNQLPLMPARTKCSEATGSVLVAGGAMFGEKRNSAPGRKEAASFAARALLGSIRFDTIAIPVIATHSVTKVVGMCNGDSRCMETMYAENDRFLKDLALEVGKELTSLGVPKDMLARVVVFPVCKIGTDYEGQEKDNLPCDWSAYMGQRMVNDLGYTLFSPFHKWYATFDLGKYCAFGIAAATNIRLRIFTNSVWQLALFILLYLRVCCSPATKDEFAVAETSYLLSPRTPYNHRHVPWPRSAADLFDRRNAVNRKEGLNQGGRLFFGWLDFKLTVSQLHNSSLEVLRHGGLEFVPNRPQKGGSRVVKRSKCTIQGDSKPGKGKTAVSCMNGGFGTHVHDSLGLKNPLDLASRFCTTPKSYDTEIVLYHGHHPRFGNCRWQ